MNKNILIWALIFFTTFYLIQSFQKKTVEPQLSNDVVIQTQKTEIPHGKIVTATIQNLTENDIVIPSNCPNQPMEVYRYEQENWTKLEGKTTLDCAKLGLNTSQTIASGQTKNISYTYWNHQLFDTLGRYQIRTTIKINDEEKIFSSNEFTIKEESTLALVWQNIFYRPIYNILIFFTKVLPYHSMGFAIILLTILIRSILLVPSQKAMKAQKKMQEIQPHLEHIKKKYADNQQRMAQETMAIWKEHKVNPLGSCLPILIQLPIMIALFYVIRNGINPDNTFLLYPPLQNFSLHLINTNFLGILELTKVNILVLPILIGALQFVQMKLTMAKRKKKNENKPEIKKNDAMPDMQMVNKTMMYFMPIMITIFTASVPAGVGLYWGVSTLFGIGQQIVVNREVEKEKPSVKVIDKN